MVKVVHQEVPLRGPVLPLRGGDPRPALLEEGAGEVAGSARELRALEAAPDGLVAAEHHHRGAAHEQREHVAVPAPSLSPSSSLSLFSSSLSFQVTSSPAL